MAIQTSYIYWFYNSADTSANRISLCMREQFMCFNWRVLSTYGNYRHPTEQFFCLLYTSSRNTTLDLVLLYNVSPLFTRILTGLRKIKGKYNFKIISSLVWRLLKYESNLIYFHPDSLLHQCKKVMSLLQHVWIY